MAGGLGEAAARWNVVRTGMDGRLKGSGRGLWVGMSLEREWVNGAGLQIGKSAGQSFVAFCGALRAPTYSRSSDILALREVA